MHDTQGKKRKRRQRRRPYKEFKRTLAAIGVPSGIFGACVCIIAVIRGNSPLLAIGAFYILLGALCLLIRWILGRLGRRPSQPSQPSGVAPDRNEGFALVLVLVMVLLASGLTMHALASARMAVRAAQRATLDAQARIAASDQAWNAVRDLIGAAAPTGSVTTAFSGGGIPVHTSTQPIAAAGPAPGAPPPGGTAPAPAPAGSAPPRTARPAPPRLYTIRAVAGTNGVQSEVYCRARREAGGAVRIERWVLP